MLLIEFTDTAIVFLVVKVCLKSGKTTIVVLVVLSFVVFEEL